MAVDVNIFIIDITKQGNELSLYSIIGLILATFQVGCRPLKICCRSSKIYLCTADPQGHRAVFLRNNPAL